MINFNWFRKKEEFKAPLSMIGDLDKLVRKNHTYRLRGIVYNMPELTVREYSQMVKILKDIDEGTQSGDVAKVDTAYEEMFSLACPDLPKSIRRSLTVSESHGLFILVLQHIGIEPAKVGEVKKKETVSKQRKT